MGSWCFSPPRRRNNKPRRWSRYLSLALIRHLQRKLANVDLDPAHLNSKRQLSILGIDHQRCKEDASAIIPLVLAALAARGKSRAGVACVFRSVSSLSKLRVFSFNTRRFSASIPGEMR